MAKVIKGIFGIGALAVVLFIALVVFGLYKALDAAPSATLASSAASPATEQVRAMDNDLTSLLGLKKVDTEAAQVGTDTEEPLLQTAEGTSLGAMGESSASGTGGSRGGAGGPASSSASNAKPPVPSVQNTSAPAPSTPNNPPQTQTPQRTYHPAWDELVESGYTETKTYPATYGERPLYGSICSECGANVSGAAASHLKATHHSGYYEGVVGTETYEITPARTEQVWVDTSYWQHHEAYWD